MFLQAVSHQNTLLPLRYHTEYRAERGEHGGPQNRTGAAGADVIVSVPPGTSAAEEATGQALGEVLGEGERLLLARGGRGGKGNRAFLSNRNRAPREAEPGEPGEERWLRLDLRLIADVGLLGFPNAGKSTLVSRLSRARPKIADYPFTTLQPHLGVVQYKGGRSFVLSDLPGLIEGAHEGAGLGHRFLKHMQRCRVIVHLVDAAAPERDPLADFDAINRELELFDQALRRKTQVVAANKIDLPEARERAEAFAKQLKRRKIRVHLISGATGEGLDGILDAMVNALDAAGVPQPLERDLHPHEAAAEGAPDRSARARRK